MAAGGSSGMFDLLKLRMKHGSQAIPDLRAACPSAGFRGIPVLDSSRCADDCALCVAACSTGAINVAPLRIDLGACVFCNDCVRACPADAIQFSRAHRMGATSRQALIVIAGTDPSEMESRALVSRREIRRLFGRSLRLRQVSAGGCNGCELELGAAGNVNFDMSRFGIDFVASPRHADGLVLTGPVTRNMVAAVLDSYRAIAEPRIVIAFGACAISGGLFAAAPGVDRSVVRDSPVDAAAGVLAEGGDWPTVDLYVPGCPPHPLVFIDALLAFLGRR